MEFKCITLAKIRRPHGLKGALVTEIYNHEKLAQVFEKQLPVSVNFYDHRERRIKSIDVEIEHIFGVVKNVCRMKFVGYDDVSQLEEFRNVFLEIENTENEFCLEDLVGMDLYYQNQFISKITAIHDFGAGIVVDTEKEMFTLDSLDLENIANGRVQLKPADSE